MKTVANITEDFRYLLWFTDRKFRSNCVNGVIAQTFTGRSNDEKIDETFMSADAKTPIHVRKWIPDEKPRRFYR